MMTMFSRKFLRFTLNGGLVFCVDFLALWGLQWLMPPWLAVSLAYVTAVTVHFLLSRNWVFQSRHRALCRQLVPYVFCVGLCWLCTISCFSLGLHMITSNIYLAKALSLPPSTLLGYFLMRRLVFHPIPGPRHSASEA